MSKPSFLSIVNDLLDDLINAESENTAWHQQLYCIKKINDIDFILLSREENRANAIEELVKMKVYADKVLQRVKEIKSLVILPLPFQKLNILDELTKYMEKIVAAEIFFDKKA